MFVSSFQIYINIISKGRFKRTVRLQIFLYLGNEINLDSFNGDFTGAKAFRIGKKKTSHDFEHAEKFINIIMKIINSKRLI